MKFKYGQRVVVTKQGFYNQSRGVVVSYMSIGDTYDVRLKQGDIRSFHGVELKKAGK